MTHQIKALLPVRGLKMARKNFPTRFSCNNFLQDFPATFSRNIFPQEFPTRFSCKIFPSWILISWLPITLFQMLKFPPITAFLKLAFFLPPCPARFSHKNFPQDFPARIFCKIFSSWILIGWLPSPYSKC